MANMHLVTGFAGREHVTSIDQGLLNAYIFGNLEVVMERGSQFEASIISNNIIRVKDGDLLMQGRFARLNDDSYVDVTIENGTQGYFRNDLIVARYQKDAITAVETVDLVVIKGENAASDPVDPAHVKGDIKSGKDFVNDVPLWRVSLDGLNVTGLTCLYSTFFGTLSRHADRHSSGGDDPITLAAIGAAPAGYGLGEVVESVFTTIEQVDAFKVSGVRAVSLTDGNHIGGSTNGKLVCVATAKTYTQTFSFYYAGYGGLISLERVCTNELDWQEWESVNPPMKTGAEYRTTERYNGEVVYKKLSSGGNPMWRPESSSTWRIPLDNSNMFALGCSQIQTGSYTGTGAYGSSSPSSLTFNFEPKMVVIQAVGASFRLMWFYGASVMQHRGGSGSGWNGTVTANTKTFKWYDSSADMQANTSGQKYNWIAIG